jgi:hypothetical protein
MHFGLGLIHTHSSLYVVDIDVVLNLLVQVQAFELAKSLFVELEGLKV